MEVVLVDIPVHSLVPRAFVPRLISSQLIDVLIMSWSRQYSAFCDRRVESGRSQNMDPQRRRQLPDIS